MKVQPPQPLTCLIDEQGRVHTTWDVKALRRYLDETTDVAFLVTTETGEKVQMLVARLRLALTPETDEHLQLYQSAFGHSFHSPDKK
jgi:hypothetical protein